MEFHKDKKTILHCIDSLALGGAEKLLKDTLPLLTDYNSVVCYLHPPDGLIPEFANYPVHCLNYTSKFSFFSSVKQAREIIRKYDVSIIHAHLFWSTLLTRIACPRKTKFVFTIHNVLSKDAFEVNRLSLWAEKITYGKRQLVVGVSKEVLNDYDKWVGIKGKSFVLHNYVNEMLFTLPRNNVQDISAGLKLISVGNLRRQKNYSRLLEAFSLMKDLPVSLDIYGSGDLESELVNKIENGKLNVRLMGKIDDVSRVLPCYHAYIMASLFEGFGIAPMEAMAAGMPVLLSNLNVFKEIAEDIPVYFEPDDPESIANAIRYTYRNWQKVHLNGQRGKLLIKQKASRGAYLAKLIEIYES
jgi:glycosyltransferase involved in cell wall biosynthesis